jgi:EAL domain-containing protein (putative c-di-GMP-specific phosphodiesterase class I)
MSRPDLDPERSSRDADLDLPYTVVLAEDDPIIREAMVAVLSASEDFVLIGVAEDAEQAIVQVVTSQPDVAVLDVRMPYGGGPHAAREISAACPNTRIIALSAQEDRDSVGSMIGAGASGYVTKDAPPEQLLDTIKRCAAGESIFMPVATKSVMQEVARTSRILEETARRRRTRIENLREAITAQSLTCAFQPVINLDNGDTMMIEALARFISDQPFTTGEWFEEAVSLGMSSEIDMATLGTAIATVKQAHYDDSLISLNVLPETLLNPNLSEILSGIEPDRIVLEVTEHARIADYSDVKNALADLREKGMKLAIDDAGAGFASLRHILDLMPDLIKLDISLSRNIDTDQARRSLATGLITFAREIGAEIVAEGIETPEELATLRDLGVHYGQGYHLARPAPLEHFDESFSH